MSHESGKDAIVFSEAISLPEAERADYVERACAGDADLRHRVEILLKAFKKAGNFLNEPAPGVPKVAGTTAAMGEKPGDRIGRYKLLQQIGEGGCGVVYMAQQEEPVRRRVALKIIKPGMDTKSVIARFEAERQALALMDHPSIAKVFDAGATESGRPYFVMELIRGVKITEYCDQQSLTTEGRLELFVQVCQAVQHAHQKGIIHRDIKPSNILVTTTAEGMALPVVIDFGIAKATTNQLLTDKTLFTAFEMLIGTPAYMSPEQAALTSVDVDTRTDIYSLGVLLYELLTGSTPFDSSELLKAGLDEIRRTIQEREPDRPSTRLSKLTKADITTIAQYRQSEPPKLIRCVHGDLDWIVMKALEKDRGRRYATAYGMAQDVQRFLDGETVSARPPSTFYKLQKTVRRNKLLFAGVAVIAGLLVASLVVVSALLATERQARREADAALHQSEVEKAQSESEMIRSRQMTQFLEDMLQGVEPAVARGRDTTMLREILDRTAARVGPETTNQPAIECELRSLIGQLYFEIGNYKSAEEMQKTALVIERKAGSESKVAELLDGLGMTLYKEGNLAGAEDALKEAIGIRRRIFGDENAETASAINDLATVYRHERKLAESEALTREALETRRKLFGDNSLAVADSLHNLCVVLGDEGNRMESETTARRILAIRRSLLGAEDPLVAAALNDVAWAASYNGKLEEAESLQREALAIQRKYLGDENPAVAATLSSLGQTLGHRGNLTEADALLSSALSIQRKLLGENNPEFLYSLDGFARTLEDESKWPEAEMAHRESLTGWRNLGEQGDLQAIVELGGLVRALVAQKKFGEAKQRLDEALTPAFIKDPACADLLALRVDLMGRQGRWQEAITDATLGLEYQSTDHYKYHILAGLLAITHNRHAYEQLCRKILATFGGTKDPYVADRMAEDCLLLPDSGVDLQRVDKLANIAVTLGSGDNVTPYFEVGKALAEYRTGHFSEAIEWGEKPLNYPVIYAQAKAYAVLAMAHWQLGQKDAARGMLAKGDGQIPSISIAPGAVDLGDGWVPWLFARVTLNEATAMIRPGSAAK